MWSKNFILHFRNFITIIPQQTILRYIQFQDEENRNLRERLCRAYTITYLYRILTFLRGSVKLCNFYVIDQIQKSLFIQEVDFWQFSLPLQQCFIDWLRVQSEDLGKDPGIQQEKPHLHLTFMYSLPNLQIGSL